MKLVIVDGYLSFQVKKTIKGYRGDVTQCRQQGTCIFFHNCFGIGNDYIIHVSCLQYMP